MMKKLLLIIPMIFLALAVINFASATNYCVGANFNFTCGDAINESCNWNGSIDCGMSGGLAIHGNDIVFDCKGYTFKDSILGPSGVTLNGGDSNITIQNCHFEGWGAQIDITNSDYPLIQNNTFFNFSSEGINALDWGNARIYNNAFDCQDTRAYGIWVATAFVSGGNASIINNTITNCGAGIVLDDVNNTIYNVTITDCMTGIYINNISNLITQSRIDNSYYDYGISIGSLADYNNVTYTNITNSGSAGIYLSGSWYNLLDHNRIINVSGGNPFTGIHLTDSSNNIVSNNYIYNASPVGIGLYLDSEWNVLENNTIIRGDNLGYQDGIDIIGGSINNLVIRNNISNFDNYSADDYCIYIDESDSNNISENILDNCFMGIDVYNSSAEQIDKNKIICSDEGSSGGIYLEGDGFNFGNVLDSNNITLCNLGIEAYEQVFIFITNNRITNLLDNGFGNAGIMIDSSAFLTIGNNYLNNFSKNYSAGMVLFDIAPLTIYHNTINNTDNGIFLFNVTGFVNSDSNNITNVNYTLYAEDTNGTFTNLTTDHALIDTLNFENISLQDIISYPTLPSGKTAFVVYNITNTTEVAYLDLNISYDGTINESSLSMWAYRSSWNSLPNSIDTTNNIVYANNMTSFSLFAPLSYVYVPPYNPGGSGGPSSYCGDGTCNNGETTLSCPVDCASTQKICCEYSCFFSFCSHNIITQTECTSYSGHVVDNSKCASLPTFSLLNQTQNPIINNTQGTSPTSGTCGGFNWIIILIVAGIIIFFIIKSKK